jgi:hypothetical protein
MFDVKKSGLGLSSGRQDRYVLVCRRFGWAMLRSTFGFHVKAKA